MSSRTSPRTSALSRASSLPRYRSGVSDLAMRFEENVLPVLLLVAVVAAAAIAWVVGARYEKVAADEGWADVFRCGTLAGVALLIVLGCTAWVTAYAYMHSASTARMVLLALFLGIAVVTGVALWLFFNRDERTIAFYLMVAVAVAVLVHCYLVWRASHFMGLIGMVPAVVFVAYLLWRFWPACLTSTA